MNVGPWCRLRAGGNQSGLLRTFGERQIMAQLIAGRWLVPSLIHKDFRACHLLLASGDFASDTLNHQKCARANIHYSRVHVSLPYRMGVYPEISMPTLSILTGVILPLHGLVTR
jgi:hypothetical protein